MGMFSNEINFVRNQYCQLCITIVRFSSLMVELRVLVNVAGHAAIVVQHLLSCIHLNLLQILDLQSKESRKPIIRFSHYSEVEKDKVGSNTIESSSHIFRKWIRFASNVIII